MKDRIQLIKEAAERLKSKKLETIAKQPLPFEKNKAMRKEANQSVQTNNTPCLGKNGVRTMYRTYGNYATMQLFQETKGMTAIEGETPGYRHDY